MKRNNLKDNSDYHNLKELSNYHPITNKDLISVSARINIPFTSVKRKYKLRISSKYRDINSYTNARYTINGTFLNTRWV